MIFTRRKAFIAIVIVAARVHQSAHVVGLVGTLKGGIGSDTVLPDYNAGVKGNISVSTRFQGEHHNKAFKGEEPPSFFSGISCGSLTKISWDFGVHKGNNLGKIALLYVAIF